MAEKPISFLAKYRGFTPLIYLSSLMQRNDSRTLLVNQTCLRLPLLKYSALVVNLDKHLCI